ncbi:MAG TPA: ATPase domain-containing protein [archaeon]|nr:ATPase domain-containing protein [archaeon]
MVERSKTGIDGLDKALNGGFPFGNVVLVSGGAGTGKSTMCLQYIINGATKYGERGLYISTEQQKKELYKTADSFGWNLKELEDAGKIRIIYFDVVETDGFLEKIYEAYTSFNPKRVVIDSLTTLADSLLVAGSTQTSTYTMIKISQSVSPIPQSERIVTKNLLYHLLKKLRLFDSTILLTSELLEGEKGLSADAISEFICDGVITMHYLEIGVSDFRSLQIRKMRYTSHEKSTIPYDISTTGITIMEEDKL